jgi:hypothetical protein
VAHEAAQQQWPVAFALAGLPTLPRVLAEAKSYTERFDYREIGSLDQAAAAQVLTLPAAEEGVDWTPAAVRTATAAADGFPYFLQQYGQEIWDEAGGSPITEADARVGVAKGQAGLDAGFFRSRWERASVAEKRYLRAMAQDGAGPSETSALADRLGKAKNSLGPSRANLLAKGLIYSPSHGQVAFTVPRMADFITRQPSL